jgi:hypothetical protein
MKYDQPKYKIGGTRRKYEVVKYDQSKYKIAY